MGKVVVTHGGSRELAPLKGAIAALGYDVLECGSALETLQFAATQPIEVLITSASLPDLNGYQLACLMKSRERTRMLPIIVVNVYAGKGSTIARQSPMAPLSDEFAALAKRCRMVIEATDSPQALKALQSLLPRSSTTRKSLAGTLGKGRKHTASSLVRPEDKYSAENLLVGTADVVNEMLIERIVSDKIVPVLKFMDSRSTFAEHFFNAAKQLVDCSVCGLVLACTPAPWGTVFISGHQYRKKGLSDWLRSVGEYNFGGLDIDFDVRGQLYDDGDSLPEPAVFEVGKGEDILGLLVFAPPRPSGFDELSLKTIRCLQKRMEPIMQVRLDRERVTDKQRFPIVTDELTGVYNLDFLVGFMQQQMLFSFRQRTPLALVLLHIEGIREVNSKIGWEVGDHLLSQVATWLTNHTRGSDIVARCSGSTFAVVLPNTTLEGAQIAIDKYVEEIAQMEFAGNITLKILAGCAIAKPAELNPEVLLRDAQNDLQSRLTVPNPLP
jgi:diguanylate cyclase (GGDEF)-like protein